MKGGITRVFLLVFVLFCAEAAVGQKIGLQPIDKGSVRGIRGNRIADVFTINTGLVRSAYFQGWQVGSSVGRSF